MFKQYRKIEPGEQIVVATDTAGGGGDFTASQFLSVNKLDVPLVYHSAQTTSSYVVDHCNKLEEIFDITGNRPITAYERNNGGNFLMDRVAAGNHAGKYKIFEMPKQGSDEASGIFGWSTNTATRPKMLQDLQDAINTESIIIYDKETIKELYSFVVVQTNSSYKAQAEKNCHDDLVMALAIAYQMYIFSKINTSNAVNDQSYAKYENYQQQNPYDFFEMLSNLKQQLI